jgi:thiol-disulfide isomerase/thioredoxin
MKSPNRTIAIWLAGFLFSATLALAEVAVGQPFPKLADSGLIGHLPDQSGRVVLVDFWATWCAPCRSSFPAYDALQREFGDRGLAIIGVSVDQEENHYTRFVEKFAPGFSTVRDAEQKLVTAVHPPAMPTCYLIDRHGVVQAVHTGFHGGSTTRQLREEIIKLLEEKT